MGTKVQYVYIKSQSLSIPFGLFILHTGEQSMLIQNEEIAELN